MHYQKEARRSLENYRRAPSKGEIILANHPYICALVVVAFLFTMPRLLGEIASVLYV